jgi:SAM-dependent methyltransferase
MNQQHNGLETLNCPLCHHASYRIFNKYGYWIRECKMCHHRFAEISPSAEHLGHVYQDGYFKGDAAGYPDYLSEANSLLERGRQYGALLSKYTLLGSILDVGAAAGFILKGFQESGWCGVGLEPNLSMSVYGRTHLGLQIEMGCLEEFSPVQQFDVVSMIQVVSHFFDIRRAIQRAAMITRPGGFWLIETWDRESWIARLLGKHWHEYNPPSALHWFSPLSLGRFVAQFGFSEVARGRPAKRLSGAHAKCALRRMVQTSRLGWLEAVLKIIPDQLVIPYPAFDLFWILFQQGTNAES